jgi:hypothetical protein
MDPRANSSYPLNAQRLEELRAAGIPMRKRLTSYILHWKMMLFHGQNVVQFSGANYSGDAWVPLSAQPYANYIDEAIYFTSDTPIVDSFRTKFDDQWIETTNWVDYANITAPLTRRYPVSPKHPSLNFPPDESFRTRSVNLYKTESQKIDAIMYRITDRRHTDTILAAVARGVPVRLLTEPVQYRDRTRLWHSWNVDRLYMGGVQVKHRAHAGLNHQKSVILYGHQTTIFGSSNWTSPSAAGQLEHNIFTTKPYVFSWLVNQFERKWNNSSGVQESTPFVPLPPDQPRAPSPADRQAGLGTTVTLRWHGGPWAHLYDVYLGTAPDPPLVASNLALGPSESSTQMQSHAARLAPGRTYYWRIVAKTMAMRAMSSPTWSFTTGGSSVSVYGISDFDGDGVNDPGVFRPSTGDWILQFSSLGFASGAVLPFGLPTDKPVAGDYDGDGRLDTAVYRPSNGNWFVILSSSGTLAQYQWGISTDVPMPADYTGDGRTDLAVWRPSTGVWFVYDLATRTYTTRQWGLSTDKPLTGDYDRDGKADVAVFRPSGGRWYVFFSSTQTWSVMQWGISSDIPVPADFTGDGRTDLAVYRPANGFWFVYDLATASYSAYQWGLGSDIPAPRDYDGDRRADLAIWRPSTGTFFIYFVGTNTFRSVPVGVAGAVPIR